MSIISKEDSFDPSSFGNLKAVIDASIIFLYQGFDPEKFFPLIQEVYIEQMKAENSKIKPGEIKVEFIKDSKILIGVYCSAGIKLKAKRLAHSTDQAIQILDVLKRRFKLQTDGAAPNDAKTITIQRFAACFAHVVARVYATKDVNLRIPGQINPDLHHALHFAMAPSLIPNNKAFEVVYQQWFVWACSFDEVINQGKSDPSLVHGFAMIQRRSNYYPHDFRVKLMAELGIDPAAYATPDASLFNGAVGKLIAGTLKENTNTSSRVGASASGGSAGGSGSDASSGSAPNIRKVTGK